MKGAEMSSEDVLTVALDALTAALEAPSKVDGIFDSRAVLAGLDGEALRRVAGCLAVEMAWRPKADKQALLTWAGQVRLEVAWHAPTIGPDL